MLMQVNTAPCILYTELGESPCWGKKKGEHLIKDCLIVDTQCKGSKNSYSTNCNPAHPNIWVLDLAAYVFFDFIF